MFLRCISSDLLTPDSFASWALECKRSVGWIFIGRASCVWRGRAFCDGGWILLIPRVLSWLSRLLFSSFCWSHLRFYTDLLVWSERPIFIEVRIFPIRIRRFRSKCIEWVSRTCLHRVRVVQRSIHLFKIYRRNSERFWGYWGNSYQFNLGWSERCRDCWDTCSYRHCIVSDNFEEGNSCFKRLCPLCCNRHRTVIKPFVARF